jgi:hypothetical protein
MKIYRVERDGFEGVQVGSYVTLEGYDGIVLQQIGTKVIHVYRRKWAVDTGKIYDHEGK